jgi:hypothetical protein
MPRPAWNDIESQAAVFAASWAGESHERAEAQTFWSDFLALFGIDRRRHGGYFEYAVRLDAARRGFIDMFLPGKLLAEHKSAGRDLRRAQQQALDYLPGIPDAQLPEAIVVSDFATFQVLNLTSRQLVEFPLTDLPKHVREFAFLLDEETSSYVEESPVNRAAAEQMAALHDALRDTNYRDHKLRLFLVRLVFCNFADDARIFPRGAFEHYLRTRTREDGTDLGPLLGKLFETLNTPEQDRSRVLDADLAALPYINGGLFAEAIPMPDFDRALRAALLKPTEVDWSEVSPAIFGSMFQGVMSEVERHDLGAHYTSEQNILRAIGPLFLDDLYLEFDRVRTSPARLNAFHDKLAQIRVLDPACGCGNFLVITYRELRRLEHRVIDALQKGQPTLVDVRDLLKVAPEQMYGIELEEFPGLIARTALWLTDHQMNLEAGQSFGVAYTRIPLHEGAHIVEGNALTLDWNTVITPNHLTHIVGNPPFNGSRTMLAPQKAELRAVARGLREAGFLDYVAGWYIRAAEYVQQNKTIRFAFVSTNSLTQGEQPGILWSRLWELGCSIAFAHRTFRWRNDARGVAAVHCVIIGITADRPGRARPLYSYLDIDEAPILTLVDRINPYLIDSADTDIARTRQTQISGELEMAFGNMAADGGNLILTADQAHDLLDQYPAAGEWVKPFIGAREFLQGGSRYCLWLDGVEPREIRAVPPVYDRVAANRAVRAASARPKLADVAQEFAQITQQPEQPFLLIPRHSSENRDYVPLGLFEAGNIGADSCLVLPDATLFHFGVLQSRMHMAWLRTVSGRLKSDYRYSKDVVYNNFVWPTVNDDDRGAIGDLARDIFDARLAHDGATLADLYDPAVMPRDLRTAHRALDAAVDRAYRKAPFADDVQRVAMLFERLARRTRTTTERPLRT